MYPDPLKIEINEVVCKNDVCICIYVCMCVYIYICMYIYIYIYTSQRTRNACIIKTSIQVGPKVGIQYIVYSVV